MQSKQEPSQETVSFSSHEEIEKAIRTCRRCHLAEEGGHGPVLSTGPVNAPLMIIGEGPGGVEDEYGAPLVGPSGKLLDKALWSVGITRDKVYVTNIVKCRPRGNRTPTMEEASFCGHLWLDAEICLAQPKVIIALGKTALRFLLGRDASIVRSRGHWIMYRGIPVMPTFHPAYLLRQEGKDLAASKWNVYYDLKAAKEKAAEADPSWVWKSDAIVDLLGSLNERRKERQAR